MIKYILIAALALICWSFGPNLAFADEAVTSAIVSAASKAPTAASAPASQAKAVTSASGFQGVTKASDPAPQESGDTGGAGFHYLSKYDDSEYKAHTGGKAAAK